MILIILLLLILSHTKISIFRILFRPIKWLIAQLVLLVSFSCLIFVGKGKRAKIKRAIPRLPTELIVEILVRLPLKHVSRAQLVCKEWQALTRDHHFIQKHTARTPVVYHWRNNLAAPKVLSNFRFMHGCDGVVILYNYTSKKYLLWNPAIFRVLELPDPNPGPIIELALLYVPATRDYRVVSFYHKDKYIKISIGCEILTLNGPSWKWKWKNLDLDFPLLPFPEHVPNPSKKVLVIPTGRDVHCIFVTMKDATMIVTLDVEAESFAVNHHPGDDDVPTTAINWDGKLGFVNIVGKSLELIKLQDYKEHKWGAEKTTIPLPFEGISVRPLFNRGGDIWFWITEKEIISYNIETGKIEHVMEESRALSYECGLVYPYKRSLLSFEGMRSDKDDANLQRHRP